VHVISNNIAIIRTHCDTFFDSNCGPDISTNDPTHCISIRFADGALGIPDV